MVFESKIRTIEWLDNKSRMIDQTLLPLEFKFVDVNSAEEMYFAIKNMIVRGAPAIGIAGAHGMALAGMEIFNKISDKETFMLELEKKALFLISARPTAVNLEWAVKQQLELAKTCKGSVDEIIKLLINNAKKLENEDIEINKKIGEYGAEVVPKGAKILTHCNAGALATVGYGTALGVIRSAYAKDSSITVYADETRPRQQGARLTAWELTRDNIPTTLITDGMCSYFMQKGLINFVVTGADRIAANGDTANKIGTYTVAIAAKYHNIPFYIAAPTSTIDISISSGKEINIEERSREEVTIINGEKICPDEVNVINPAFDVTPNSLISGIITEKGILRPDYKTSISQALKASR